MNPDKKFEFSMNWPSNLNGATFKSSVKDETSDDRHFILDDISTSHDACEVSYMTAITVNSYDVYEAENTASHSIFFVQVSCRTRSSQTRGPVT